MSLLQYLSIQARVLLIPVLASLGFAAYLAYSYAVLSDNSERFFYIRDVSFPIIEQTDHGLVRLERIRETLNAAVASDELELVDEADAMADETRQLLQVLLQLAPDQQPQIQQLQQLFQAYYQQARSLSVAMLDGSADFATIQPRIEQMSQALEDIMQGMKAFRSQSHDRFLSTIEDANQQASESVQMGVITGAVLMLVLMVLAFTMARQVSCNLRRVIESLHSIANGEGDLSQRLKPPGDREMAQLSHNFNSFVEKIDKLVGALKGASGQMIPISRELASSNEDGLQHIDQQQAFSQNVVSAMDQMAQSTHEVLHEIDEICEAVKAGNRVVGKGQKEIDITASAILGLSCEMDQTITAITQLKDDSSTVGEIIDVINAIAEQTNLLALNAAIEAARAGEAGRGFAVVADEVRELANRTRASTQMVEEMIERIQASTRVVVEAMEDGRSNVDSSVCQVKEAQRHLVQLCDVMDQINHVLGRVSDATGVQQQRIEDVRKLSDNMAQVSDETAAIVSASVSTGNQLVEVGQKMDGLVGVFRVSDRYQS
ncbi:MAG: methyl-accepting chemotaxis protein [Marinobacterium sp.]|nr:methyl-accepting chemotaxis protein [Marinobacterium sp.]